MALIETFPNLLLTDKYIFTKVNLSVKYVKLDMNGVLNIDVIFTYDQILKLYPNAIPSNSFKELFKIHLETILYRKNIITSKLFIDSKVLYIFIIFCWLVI